jgi:hypothetical protein
VWAAYACLDWTRKRTDEVTRGDDQWVLIEEEVLEVSASASNQEVQTIMKEVVFRKHLAKVDPIEKMT